jgi:hypothetical protein
MTKLEFRYSRLTGVVAIVAVMFMPAMWVSKATDQPPPATADVANEQRVITKYFEDFVTYDKQAAVLGKRSTFLLADLEPLQRKSDDLKGGLSGVQNAVREIIKKLKAAGEWNDVDASLAARITDPNEKAFFQGKSFKRLLEDSADNLSSHRNEVSAPLDNLRKRLTSRYPDGEDFQIIRAGYEAPGSIAPIGSKDSLGCTLGKLGLAAIRLSGGTPTNLALNVVFNQCWPEGSVSPF